MVIVENELGKHGAEGDVVKRKKTELLSGFNTFYLGCAHVSAGRWGWLIVTSFTADRLSANEIKIKR